MIKHDISWGNSVAVRDALSTALGFDSIEIQEYELNYQPFNGDEALLATTARVIERQTGMTYKHLFLTNGASGAISLLLRAYRHMGYLDCITNPAPYFPLYPGMIKSAGLGHLTIAGAFLPASVVLLDSPANPTGKLMEAPSFSGRSPVILDAVYWNRVYAQIVSTVPEHDAVVGSYSKLLGLNGVRIGWIGTNNDLLAARLEPMIGAEYCGLSAADMLIANYVVGFMLEKDWDRFESQARKSLDQNREEWSHLERYFAGTPVPVNGMFAWLPVDQAAKKLLEKAGIGWMVGSKCGATDEFGRFNLGQSNRVIREAVAAVLREDKI